MAATASATTLFAVAGREHEAAAHATTRAATVAMLRVTSVDSCAGGMLADGILRTFPDVFRQFQSEGLAFSQRMQGFTGRRTGA